MATPKYYLYGSGKSKTIRLAWTVRLADSMPPKRFWYKTGVEVTPDKWDARHQEIIASHKYKQGYTDNERLKEIRSGAQLFYSQCLAQKFYPAKSQLIAHLNGITLMEKAVSSDTNFSELFESFLAERLKLGIIKEGSAIVYRSLLKNLLAFSENTGIPLNIDKVNMAFFYGFRGYCYEEMDMKQGTFRNYINTLKAFMRWCVEEKHTANRDWQVSKFMEKDFITRQIVLTEEEISKVVNFDVYDPANRSPKHKPETIRKAQILFTLLVLTGQRISDYDKLNKSRIVQEDGQEFFKFKAQKTSEDVVIPLHPNVKEILEQRGGFPPTDMFSRNYANKVIKELMRLAGITQEITIQEKKGGRKVQWRGPKYKRISMHTMRRTFATILKLQGYDDRFIMAITGHKSINAFERYLQLDKIKVAVIISGAGFFKRRVKNIKGVLELKSQKGVAVTSNQ